jgi:tetratricopeptide (TPR) repeat protein
VTAAAGAPATALMAARELLGMGRAEEARTLAALARGAYPAETSELAAQIALARHEPEAALAELRHAGERAAPALRRAVGMSLAEAGRSQEALALLEPLAGGGDPQTLDAIAIALADSGRDQEAVAILGRVLAAAPRDARAHQVLGAVALHREQPAEARRELELAVGIDPRLAVAWNGLGVARFRLEGPGAALAAWHKAVELDPDYFDALLNIGMVSAAVGQKTEARQALQRFVAKAPPTRFGADLLKARSLLRELGS